MTPVGLRAVEKSAAIVDPAPRDLSHASKYDSMRRK
jgi:hypothetical protein